MPYARLSDLPDSVRDHLPPHAQEIYRAAFNNAWTEYADSAARSGDASREETAHKVAWAAVKQSYRKNLQTGKWERADE
jgi:cation transport regulator